MGVNGRTTPPGGGIDPDSYNAIAKRNGNFYFDMGNNKWNDYQARLKLSNGEMFEVFNKPALDYAMRNKKHFVFSDDPRLFRPETSINKELNYLKSKGYKGTLIPTNDGRFRLK